MKILIVSLLLLLTTACSQIPDSSNPTSVITWQQQQQQLEQLTHWSIKGKVAIITPNERNSANLYWQQIGDDYNIQLTSFIGSTLLAIKKTDKLVEITNNKGEVFSGDNAETLIKQLSPGLNIPINTLQSWIKGLPSNASYQLNEQNQVEHLLGKDKNDISWAVNYQGYELYETYMLPTSIQLKRGNMRVKFALKTWQIQSPPDSK